MQPVLEHTGPSYNKDAELPSNHETLRSRPMQNKNQRGRLSGRSPDPVVPRGVTASPRATGAPYLLSVLPLTCIGTDQETWREASSLGGEHTRPPRHHGPPPGNKPNLNMSLEGH
ncbi:hypothetical protein EYF80_026934 [Liparis tanakae]|uniref:Uncharacterized protein n=1 Tax=Liparis tanakae TaxID=230148 RepID=A0A4Z2HAL8_9TELE|nr:hypothetical protein EYF80_026934 [Liparis tanakae]